MYIKIVVLSLLALFLQHAARIIYTMGFHVTVYNHTPGPCRLVPGVDQGSEDMETLPNGLTFITSGLVWSLSSKEFIRRHTENNHKGKILLFDFNHPEADVTELAFEDSFDRSTFHPHGISVWQNETTGTITLFVVSHPPKADRIEKFEYIAEKQLLVHKKSYMDPAMTVVNDVAATSEDSFYFTNYAYYRDPLSHFLEVILFLPFSNIMYCDGQHYDLVADSLLMANGVVLSKDKRTLYSANGIFQSMNIYQREENDTLTLVQEYPLYSSPDNLLIEPKTGNVIIGSHPVIYRVGEHLDHPINPRIPGAAQVLMVEMENDSQPTSITELYSDDGSRLSCSTVASIHDNKMLIGTVFDKLMYCEVRTL